MSDTTLYQVNEAIMTLSEALADGDIDEATYLDTIENMGAENAIEDVVKSIRNLEAEAEAVKLERMHLDGKIKRAETQAEALRKVLVKYMQLTNASQLKAGIFKVSTGSTISLDLLDDNIEGYPDEYLIPQQPKLDKRKMLADLKNGATVDGALLKATKYIKIN